MINIIYPGYCSENEFDSNNNASLIRLNSQDDDDSDSSSASVDSSWESSVFSSNSGMHSGLNSSFSDNDFWCSDSISSFECECEQPLKNSMEDHLSAFNGNESEKNNEPKLENNNIKINTITRDYINNFQRQNTTLEEDEEKNSDTNSSKNSGSFFVGYSFASSIFDLENQQHESAVASSDLEISEMINSDKNDTIM